jgi:cell division protein FtsZ
VLTGGGSELKGIADYAQGVLGRAVRVGRPKMPGLPEAHSGPAFATLAGLAQFAASKELDLRQLVNPGPATQKSEGGKYDAAADRGFSDSVLRKITETLIFRSRRGIRSCKRIYEAPGYALEHRGECRMSIDFIRPEVDELRPRIAVIGVGGAGGNAIANMINSDVQGVNFVVANTDAQALNASSADHRIQLGLKITQGLGAGSRPEIGKAAAEETITEIEKALEGSHMCFIAAGMGGGTGTGAAPVIAKTARDKGILTVGVVTKPFSFEGNRRMRSAEAGIEELQQHVDTLIVIPNQNLFRIANPNTTFKEAFSMADEVLQQGVRGITDLMVMPGLINLDFADVRSVMGEMGKAMMGTGEAAGDNRAIEAAEQAIANPLLDGVSMKGAKGVIISITGGEDMRLMEVDEAASHIKELVDPDANIIWGSAFNNDLQGKIRVSVVATGIGAEAAMQTAPAAPAKVFAFPTSGRGAETPKPATVLARDRHCARCRARSEACSPARAAAGCRGRVPGGRAYARPDRREW